MQLKIKINLATEVASQMSDQSNPFDVAKIRNFLLMLVVMSSMVCTMAFSMYADEQASGLAAPAQGLNDEHVGILPIIMDDDAPAKLPFPMADEQASMDLNNSLSPSLFLDTLNEQEEFVEELEVSEDHNSKFVNRAQLTLAIAQREPIDNITSLSLATQKQLFFFTQINQKKDQVIYHRWMFNQKQMAQIKLSIGSNKWRTYSSKTFNRQMLGHWQVDVVDDNDQILKSVTFDVTH